MLVPASGALGLSDVLGFLVSEPGLPVWELDSLLIRLSSSVSESGLLIWVLGSSLRVLSFLSVALGLAFSSGFHPLIMSRLGLCAG